MSMLRPWSFTLQFAGKIKEHGELLMNVLDDYLKNIDYSAASFDDTAVAEWVSRIYFELKKSSACGTAECVVTMFILEKLPKIVLKYRDKKIANYSLCNQLWGYLNDATKTASGWKWGGC